jgi:hypothetical protein
MLRNKLSFILFLACIQQLVSVLEMNAQYADHDFVRYSVKEGLT